MQKERTHQMKNLIFFFFYASPKNKKTNTSSNERRMSGGGQKRTYSIGIWVCVFLFFLSIPSNLFCVPSLGMAEREMDGGQEKGNEETKTPSEVIVNIKKPFDFFLSFFESPSRQIFFFHRASSPSSRRAACLSGFSSLSNPKHFILQSNPIQFKQLQPLITSSSPTSNSSCSPQVNHTPQLQANTSTFPLPHSLCFPPQPSAHPYPQPKLMQGLKQQQKK